MSNLEDWGIDGLIKNGGVMILNKKEVKRMKAKVIKSGDKNFEEEKAKMFKPKTLSKEEQLRIVFKKLIQQFFEDLEKEYFVGDLINSYANILLGEVKIRVKL